MLDMDDTTFCLSFPLQRKQLQSTSVTQIWSKWSRSNRSTQVPEKKCCCLGSLGHLVIGLTPWCHSLKKRGNSQESQRLWLRNKHLALVRCRWATLQSIVERTSDETLQSTTDWFIWMLWAFLYWMVSWASWKSFWDGLWVLISPLRRSGVRQDEAAWLHPGRQDCWNPSGTRARP